jgi:hypothetical protein
LTQILGQPCKFQVEGGIGDARRPTQSGGSLILDAMLNVANATKFPGGLLLKPDSDPLKTEHCTVCTRWQQSALLFMNDQNPID